MKLTNLIQYGATGRVRARALFVSIAVLALVPLSTSAHAQPVHGGSMTMSIDREPSILVSGLSSSSAVTAVSPKIFDGLATYDKDFNMLPVLATAWEVAPDGLSIKFMLRQNVTWHDGKPFTSADVQFTFMNILNKFHSRGRSTYSNLTAVETPDKYTAIFKLSEPSPYIMRALAGAESPVMPKHIYAGTDPLKNPANIAPIGTGAFKFVEFQRGSHIILARNENYWDGDKPYLDQLILRLIPDSSSRAAALESGEVQYGAQYVVPLNDVARLKKNPTLRISTEGWDYNTSVNYFEFNLRRPLWQDVRVRRAMAHAIDKDFLVKNVWHGFAVPADGPITNKQADFHTTDVPKYPFDLKKAARLLDEAGHPVKSDGIRFTATIHYVPAGDMYRETAEILKQNLAKIGVKGVLQAVDRATYNRRIWTDNDFDMNIYSASNIADPVIGIQRFYWSKTIQKGVAYSNGSGYSNPEMDRLLEAGRVETDLKKRQQIYHDMQNLAMTDLPNYPLVYMQWFSVYHKSVKGLNTTGLGLYDDFSDVYLEK
jgi:peptide/nickel transport system substrate-binding protein